MTRRLVSAALVVACALATGFAARGAAAKPAAERTESFREKGPADAKITIVEFSDFECPACRAAEPSLHQVLSVYGSDIRFLFKNFPLERAHPYARRGAQAAECAGKQGRFWPYHDMLYDRQDEWTVPKIDAFLDKYAKDAGLDVAAFDACRADPATNQPIDADKKEGEDRWVTGTPTFFVNGKRFVGGRQLQERGSRMIAKVLGK